MSKIGLGYMLDQNYKFYLLEEDELGEEAEKVSLDPLAEEEEDEEKPAEEEQGM